MSLDLLAGSYPLAKVRDNHVFFLQLNTFEALKMVKDGSAASTVSLKAKNARISTPIEHIRAAFDDLYIAFKQHWLVNRPINRKGIEVIFLKDGVENMKMSV